MKADIQQRALELGFAQSAHLARQDILDPLYRSGNLCGTPLLGNDTGDDASR